MQGCAQVACRATVVVGEICSTTGVCCTMYCAAGWGHVVVRSSSKACCWTPASHPLASQRGPRSCPARVVLPDLAVLHFFRQAKAQASQRTLSRVPGSIAIATLRVALSQGQARPDPRWVHTDCSSYDSAHIHTLRPLHARPSPFSCWDPPWEVGRRGATIRANPPPSGLSAGGGSGGPSGRGGRSSSNQPLGDRRGQGRLMYYTIPHPGHPVPPPAWVPLPGPPALSWSGHSGLSVSRM